MMNNKPHDIIHCPCENCTAARPYTHYTELPTGFEGIPLRGERQRDRAERLMRADLEAYWLENKSAVPLIMVFWMKGEEIETTGEWVQYGRGRLPAILRKVPVL